MNQKYYLRIILLGLALAAAFALLVCQPVMAEGEPPPEPPPEAPAPVQPAPAAAEPDGGGETAAPEGGGEAPLATAELGILAGPYAWYYCSAEPIGDPVPGNGKCEETSLANVILNFAGYGGSGLVYMENSFLEVGSNIFNAIPKMTGLYTETGLATINGNLTISGFTGGFKLSGNTGAVGNYGMLVNGIVFFTGNSGAITISDL